MHGLVPDFWCYDVIMIAGFHGNYTRSSERLIFASKYKRERRQQCFQVQEMHYGMICQEMYYGIIWFTIYFYATIVSALDKL